MVTGIQFQCLEELRDYVKETLCSNDRLEAEAFPLTERLLVRDGTPCGMYFCLHGPRAVKFVAIWETDRNTLLFYGANGQRFQKTSLAGAPRLISGAA